MERVAAEINATKGRVADLERPRPPVAYPHGFDLCWSGTPAAGLSEGNGGEAYGCAWTPQADVIVHAVTVVTTAALSSNLDVYLFRVGVDSVSAGTLTGGDTVASFSLASPLAVPPGVRVRPSVSLSSFALADADVGVTVILRGRSRAEWASSAGLVFVRWDAVGEG